MNEMVVTVLLKQDLHFTHTCYRAGEFLNFCMLKDPDLKQKHQKREYKHYVYSNLSPYEPGGTYQKGRVYFLKLRSMDSSFIRKMNKVMKESNDFFQVIAIEMRKQTVGMIEKIHTLNPVIITLGKTYWSPAESLEKTTELLHMNAEKKYNHFFQQSDQTHSFIKSIEILNRQPIPIKYKDITFLGNKFDIYVNEDERSQNIARLSLFSGIGEKNSSIGAGFGIPIYYR